MRAFVVESSDVVREVELPNNSVPLTYVLERAGFDARAGVIADRSVACALVARSTATSVAVYAAPGISHADILAAVGPGADSLEWESADALGS